MEFDEEKEHKERVGRSVGWAYKGTFIAVCFFGLLGITDEIVAFVLCAVVVAFLVGVTIAQR